MDFDLIEKLNDEEAADLYNEFTNDYNNTKLGYCDCIAPDGYKLFAWNNCNQLLITSNDCTDWCESMESEVLMFGRFCNCFSPEGDVTQVPWLRCSYN